LWWFDQQSGLLSAASPAGREALRRSAVSAFQAHSYLSGRVLQMLHRHDLPENVMRRAAASIKVRGKKRKRKRRQRERMNLFEFLVLGRISGVWRWKAAPTRSLCGGGARRRGASAERCWQSPGDCSRSALPPPSTGIGALSQRELLF
jgi:hypothetical protein